MDELPTDAVMTIDRARILPGDAMSDRADPAELLDIDVDEFTPGISLQRSRRRRCGDFSRSEASRRAGGTAASRAGAGDRPRLPRQQALTLQFFAGELAGAANGFRLLPDSTPTTTTTAATSGLLPRGRVSAASFPA